MITALAHGRGHRFSLEHAVFLSVLHRLMRGGSDLAADRWREDYRIAGSDALELHHLYRAMAWLGEALPADQQDAGNAVRAAFMGGPGRGALFAHRRDLFSQLDLVFIDTTSRISKARAARRSGEHGFRKDHRPDLHQMILAVVIDGDGRPVCSECGPATPPM